MVKLSELDLPVIFKKQLLFKAGDWNRWHISPDEVNRSVSNTNWNKMNKSLIYSHKEAAENYAGKVENVSSDGKGNVYGDVEIWHPDTALLLKHAEAPFAISAGIAWPEEYEQPTNFFYRNFSLVSDPGVRDKEIFLNFSVDDKTLESFKVAQFAVNPVETVKGYKIATFSAVISSDSASGSAIQGKTNQKQYRGEDNDDEDDKKEEFKDKIEIPKKEFVEEHKNLVEVLKEGSKEEQIKEANKQEKELKEEDMCNKANMEIMGNGKESIESSKAKEHEAKETPEEEKEEDDEKKEEFSNSSKVGVREELLPNNESVNHNELEQMKEDVLSKKAQQMENMENKEEVKMNDEEPVQGQKSHSTNERRLKDKVTKETNVSSYEERLKSVEDKLAKFMEGNGSVKANFESEVKEAKAEVKAEAKTEAKVAEQPKEVHTAGYIQASPAMDEKVVDSIANKIAEKVSASRPASMTTREFGGQVKNRNEETIERLVKHFVK